MVALTWKPASEIYRASNYCSQCHSVLPYAEVLLSASFVQIHLAGLQIIIQTEHMCLKVLASPPNKFDGKDKDLKFKTWATSVEHYLSFMGRAPDTFVASAVSWLAGPPQNQAMLLMQDKPAKHWVLYAWVEAMQAALCQVDPMHEARTWLHNAVMSRESDFSRFANQFRTNFAIVQTGGDKMAMADQILLFRQAIQGTSFYERTQVDHSTNKPFASLTSVMDMCITLYQGEPGSSKRASNGGGAAGSNPNAKGRKTQGPTSPNANVDANATNKTAAPNGANKKRKDPPKSGAGKCFKCGETGHWKNECPKKSRQAFLGSCVGTVV